MAGNAHGPQEFTCDPSMTCHRFHLRNHIGKRSATYTWTTLSSGQTPLRNTCKHICIIVNDALGAAKLYCNLSEVSIFPPWTGFLRPPYFRSRHWSSFLQGGKDPWLTRTKKSCTDVRSFLGLVRYIATFLPKLADHTVILTPLTTKEARKAFPAWTTAHIKTRLKRSRHLVA